MNRFYLIICALLAMLLLVSCKSRSGKEAVKEEPVEETVVLSSDEEQFFGNESSWSERDREIGGQIKHLGDTLWNKKDYMRLNKDIDTYVDGFNANQMFHSLLEANYCLSMDKEAKNIMSRSTCSKNHKRLNEIMKERSSFPKGKTTIGASVRSSYESHQSHLTFISGFSSLQVVSKYTDEYDYAFEESKKREATDIYNAKKPACSYVSLNLQNPNFNKRREAYCDKIVELFVAEDVYDPEAAQEIKVRIRRLMGDDNMKKWTDIIEEFRLRSIEESE